MNEQIIIARDFSVNAREEILTNSCFNIHKGQLVTFSFTSQYALHIPYIFMNEYLDYSGTFLYHGEPVSKKNPMNSFYVSNEYKLIESMSISENIISFQPQKHFWGYYNPRKAVKIMRLFHQSHPLPFNLDDSVDNLKYAHKYMIFLIKAIMMNCEIILLDELPGDCDENDLKWLQQVIEYYKKQGRTFLYFTRRISPLAVESDVVFFVHYHRIMDVMFGDEYVESRYKKAMTSPHHISPVGVREKCGDYEKQMASVEFRNVFTNKYRLDIYKREVVGILDMSGDFNTTLYHYFEQDFPYTIGEKICTSYKKAVEYGLAMVSMNNDSLVFDTLTLEENLSIQMLPQISKGIIVDKNIEKYLTKNYVNRFHLNSRIEWENQFSETFQTVVYRWLMSNPKLMILDNPMFVDLESEFYNDFQKTIDEIVGKGVSIILVSTLPDICQKICDRILVIKSYDEYKLFDLRSTEKDAVDKYIHRETI